jgi:chemotaxis protein MotB
MKLGTIVLGLGEPTFPAKALDNAAQRQGGTLAGSIQVPPGDCVHRRTETGLPAQVACHGTRFFNDDALNRSGFAHRRQESSTMRSGITVAALGIAMLLSACVSPSSYQQQVQKTQTYQQLNAQLKAELAGTQAQIEQLQNLVRLTLASGILFPEGGWELSEAGKATLAKVAPTLATLTGQRIVVKGFTDDVPIGPTLRERFAGNVELSKARAESVAAFLKTQGVPAGWISTVGLGAAHPLASNDSAEGRARNRRVEIDVVEAPA